MTTLICTVSKEKVQTPLGVIIRALLKQRRLNQADLAAALNVTDSNLSQRLRIGTMTQEMLKQTGEYFGANMMDLMSRLEKGESIDSIIENTERKLTESIELELSPLEVKEVLLNAKRDQEELKEEFHQLVAQVKTWIQHDLEKSRRQEELINLLMEERAEYKSKKK